MDELHDLPRGVSFNSTTGRYEARITVGGRTKRLGAFDTAEEAGAAYQAAKATRDAAVEEVRSADIAKLAVEKETKVHVINADDYAPKLKKRTIGYRPQYAGIIQNSEGKFVTKLRDSVTGEFHLLGEFDDIEEADRVHRAAWLEERFRYAWKDVPDTVEDGLVNLAIMQGLVGDRMTMQEFRDEAERRFPTLIDAGVPIAPLLKDEFLQARGGWRIEKRPEAAGSKDPSPWIVFG